MGFNENRFGSIQASLNYNPGQGILHREDSAIYVRPANIGRVPNALDLSDAKALRDHLSALITQVEAGIEEQKPKFALPKGVGAVLKSPYFQYVRIDADTWHCPTTGREFSDVEMSVPSYRFTILSEGVEI
jgi:hypothetical protein